MQKMYVKIAIVGLIIFLCGCALERKQMLCLFSIFNNTGIKHRNIPMECYFPLACGKVTDVTQLELYSFNRQPKQAQFTVVSRWPDSSIQWICIDLFITLGKNSKKLFLIAQGRNSAEVKDDTLVYLENPDNIVVGSSQFRFYLNKDKFNFLDSVFLDTGMGFRRGTDFAPELKSNNNMIKVDSDSLELKWIRKGKLHLILEASCINKEEWNYSTRIHFYLHGNFVLLEEKWVLYHNFEGEWDSKDICPESGNMSVHVIKNTYKINEKRGVLRKKSVIFFHKNAFSRILDGEVLEMLSKPMFYGTKDQYYSDIDVNKQSIEEYNL
ncbi:MAG: hypothetical protein ABIA63_06220 [bacterium]